MEGGIIITETIRILLAKKEARWGLNNHPVVFVCRSQMMSVVKIKQGHVLRMSSGSVVRSSQVEAET